MLNPPLGENHAVVHRDASALKVIGATRGGQERSGR
jgi:hypothetical protein